MEEKRKEGRRTGRGRTTGKSRNDKIEKEKKSKMGKEC